MMRLRLAVALMCLLAGNCVCDRPAFINISPADAGAVTTGDSGQPRDDGGMVRPDAGSLCRQQGGFCLPTPDLPCPQNSHYAGTEACDGFNPCCLPDDPPDAGPDSGPRPIGSPCSRHGDCAIGHCGHIYGLGEAEVCTDECSAPDPTCPAGSACFVPGDITGFCVPPCRADGGCDRGLVCRDTATCVPAACNIRPPDGGFPGCCYTISDCPSSFACHGARCSEGVPGKCYPYPQPNRCWTDMDCAPPWQGSVQRCEGAVLLDYECTQTVSGIGSPGTCVAR
jgi:hypothetical protein